MTSPRLPVKPVLESSGRRGEGCGGTRAVRVPPILDRSSDSSLLLRPAEVADTLGLSRSKIFELLAARELPAVRIGRSTRVARAELEQWISAQVTWEPRRIPGLLFRLRTSQGKPT